MTLEVRAVLCCSSVPDEDYICGKCILTDHMRERLWLDNRRIIQVYKSIIDRNNGEVATLKGTGGK